MTYKCEHCETECETEYELDVEHRACRLKATFPGAYTEKGDGLVTFDMKKVSESLGLFSDWIIDTTGKAIHPLDGGLHFRIGAGWNEPEIWVEVPVQVGNTISSWSFRISGDNWSRIALTIEAGLEAARQHIEAKRK